jgi:hypothetical protein
VAPHEPSIAVVSRNRCDRYSRDDDYSEPFETSPGVAVDLA